VQAYLEFFTSRENVEALKKILPNYPLVNYHIIDHSVSMTNIATISIQ
jgi:methylenetetrahydrofolate reductase (NADPH)